MRRVMVVLLVACGCGSSSPSRGDARVDGEGLPGHDEGLIDAPGAALRLRGTSMSGAEFGTAVPGTFGTDYIYPDPTYATGYTSQDYFVGKGLNTFRLPFLWERLQRSLGGALDATELARLDTTVTHMTGKGAYVILDPHNFARYNGAIVGTTQVPDSAFADLWSKLASHYAANPHVIFGLMNEPHDMPTEQWRDAANAAIAAIRAANAHNLITVPGTAWTGAWSWTQSVNGQTPNAVAMLGITDPENNVVFEVHQYFDANYSGEGTTCQSTTIGTDSLQAFTQWLHTNGKRGLLGELGAANNATCLAAIDGALTVIDQNADVYIGWTWWSAGPWWGTYFMTLEPSNGSDAPQLATLAAHL